MPHKSSGRPRGRPRLSGRRDSHVADHNANNGLNSGKVATPNQTVSNGPVSSHTKRTLDFEEAADTHQVRARGSFRKSQRLAKKEKVNLYIPSSDEDDESDIASARKYRRLTKKDNVGFKSSESDTEGMFAKDREYDKDWEAQSASDISEEFDTPKDVRLNPIDEDILDLQITTPTPAPRRLRTTKQRLAAIAATQKVRTMQMHPSSIRKADRSLNKQIDPAVEQLARSVPFQQPTFLTPHPLSRDRLVIDAWNVDFYAEENASDPWASALAYDRFRDMYGRVGARRNPPWRELHGLSSPREDDTSDWAENIRWAKQQWELYGSVWTEYGYSLEMITEHRISSLWVSEEVIKAGM